MNPPYGREISAWVEKLVSEYESGRTKEAIALVPARVDTDWFRLFRNCAICFIDGRLKFSGAENSAPFPSAAAYLGKNIARFAKSFGDMGDVWVRWDG
jgi:site-specific DNA-methyltransferase (adenine-specific)